MNLKSRKIISMALVFFMMLTILPTTAFAAPNYYDILEAADASVTLDGTNDGEVTVSLVGNADMDVYCIQGDWDTKDSTGKLVLSEITTDISNMVFTGMNYADAPTGKVLWSDDTFSAPAVVKDGTKFLNATYKVAADTPAGTYTVRFKNITLTATDYNNYTDEIYWTAKITVTRPAAHVCSGTFTKGQDATCTVDGWNDYYKCSGCDKLYEDAACTTLIPDLAAWKAGDGKIAASHTWGTVTYTWADGSSCKAERVCTKDNTHKETATATITSVEKTPATETEKGWTTYTATFTEVWAVNQTKDIQDIPVLEHEHTYSTEWSKDATYHWYASTCGHDAKAVHVYDNSIDATCNVCNYTRIVSSGEGTTGTSGSGGGFSGVYNYPVIVGDTDGADVTLSDEHATAGETVTITVKPEAGKKVDEVIVTDADGDVIPVTKAGDHQYTFTMPAGKVNVEVTTENADYSQRIVMQINNKNILVNGKTMVNDVAPVIVGDRTLVPIRVVTELLGGSADWDDATRTVTLKIDGKTMNMTIGKPIPGFGTSAVIMNERTYVPVRYVMEKLGAEVEWINATRQIIIEK